MAWIPLACARKLLASAAGEAQAPNRRDVWAGPSMFPVLFLPFLPLDDAGRMILDRMHSAPWSVSILRRSVFPLEYQGMPPVLAPRRSCALSSFRVHVLSRTLSAFLACHLPLPSSFPHGSITYEKNGSTYRGELNADGYLVWSWGQCPRQQRQSGRSGTVPLWRELGVMLGVAGAVPRSGGRAGGAGRERRERRVQAGAMKGRVLRRQPSSFVGQ